MNYKRGMSLKQIEAELIKFLLVAHGGNKLRACREFGCTFKSFYDRMHRHNIPLDYFENYKPPVVQENPDDPLVVLVGGA